MSGSLRARLDRALAPVLADAIEKRVTPGVQLALRVREGDHWFTFDRCDGALHYGPDAPAVTHDTRYDLASVTKALVALTAVRRAARGAWNLADPIERYLPITLGHPVGTKSVEAICAHRSELPAWLPFFRQIEVRMAGREEARRTVIESAAMQVLEANGGAARYSDVGYILLGAALEADSGATLDDLVRAEVTAPLGLEGSIAYRGIDARFIDERIAPTEQCTWRNALMQGRVHDENAFALGGMAGHAGLFGTARAIAEIGRASLDALAGRDAHWFAHDAMRAMVAPRENGSHRLGWDGRSPGVSSAGTHSSPETFGHLGFTGTSLWCDPVEGTAVALLTNRVHPTRENPGIRELRIAVHDAIHHAIHE